MKSLAEFDAAKKSLFRAYDRVLASDLLLPVGEIDARRVRGRRDDLEHGRFFMAVCGQMKSGKSTLLNALLFGESVLPIDDTVMTAKNTLIRFGPDRRLEVEFYDTIEWDAVLRHYEEGDEDTLRGFREEVDAVATSHGVHKDECVRPVRRSDSMQGLDRLREYATPVEKGGRFSPFVKQVTVYHPSAWLKEIVVADTPGVNDPLKFREDITKDWVHKAGAVLYVAYAGQPLSQSDVDFMNEHLLHVHSRRRVIAINKMDGLDDRSQADVAGYVESLRTEGDPRLRDILGDDGSVVLTSGLGALTGQSLSAKRKSLKVPDEYRGILKDKHLDEGGSGLAKLRTLVEERLIRVDGTERCEEHSSFLESLFKRKVLDLQSRIEALDQGLREHEMSRGELLKRKKGVEYAERDSNEALDGMRSRLKADIGGHLQSFRDQVSRVKHSCVEGICSQLSHDTGDIATWHVRGGWTIKKAIEQSEEQVAKLIRDLREIANACMKARVDDFCQGLEGGLCGIRLRSVFDRTAFELMSALRGAARVDRDSLEAAVKSATGWWQRWWNTAAGRDRAENALRRCAEDAIEKGYGGVCEGTENAILSGVGHSIGRVESDLKELLRTRRSEIASLLKRESRSVAERDALQEEKAQLARTLQSVETLKRETLADLTSEENWNAGQTS